MRYLLEQDRPQLPDWFISDDGDSPDENAHSRKAKEDFPHTIHAETQGPQPIAFSWDPFADPAELLQASSESAAPRPLSAAAPATTPHGPAHVVTTANAPNTQGAGVASVAQVGQSSSVCLPTMLAMLDISEDEADLHSRELQSSRVKYSESAVPFGYRSGSAAVSGAAAHANSHNGLHAKKATVTDPPVSRHFGSPPDVAAFGHMPLEDEEDDGLPQFDTTPTSDSGAMTASEWRSCKPGLKTSEPWVANADLECIDACSEIGTFGPRGSLARLLRMADYEETESRERRSPSFNTPAVPPPPSTGPEHSATEVDPRTMFIRRSIHESRPSLSNRSREARQRKIPLSLRRGAG